MTRVNIGKFVDYKSLETALVKAAEEVGCGCSTTHREKEAAHGCTCDAATGQTWHHQRCLCAPG